MTNVYYQKKPSCDISQVLYIFPDLDVNIRVRRPGGVVVDYPVSVKSLVFVCKSHYELADFCS